MCEFAFMAVFGYAHSDEDENELDDDDEPRTPAANGAAYVGGKRIRRDVWDDEEDLEFGKRVLRFSDEVDRVGEDAADDITDSDEVSVESVVAEGEEDSEEESPNRESAPPSTSIPNSRQGYSDGPFGLSAEMSVSTLLGLGAVVLDSAGQVLQLSRPPKSHPAIDALTLHMTDSALLRIVGRSAWLEGTERATATFDMLRAQLQVRYGRSSDEAPASATAVVGTGVSASVRRAVWYPGRAEAAPFDLSCITLEDVCLTSGRRCIELTYTFASDDNGQEA